ncbi:MAG: hypothetical protein CAF42_014725 [Nitrospira sp. CG24B]|nr:MAG: hypothetical protein CAF42_014725 [Nitrospira sp. CG24B]
MRVRCFISTVVAAIILSPSLSLALSDSLKICTLLTREELASVGVAVTGLFPDDSASLKKGSLPGLITDMQMDQCTSEMAGQYTAFPVRWSVSTTKDPIDKKAWEQMADALDQNEKKSAGDSEQRLTIEGIDCSTFSGPMNGKQIYEVGCTAFKSNHSVTLEFAQIDKAKLPPAKTVKRLLDKILSRL